MAAAVACASLALALAAPASAETTPPSLTTLSLNPSVVNTSTGSATVTIAVTATDAGSGIHVVRAGLTGPTGVQFDTSFFGNPSSGTSNNGTWQLDVTLPQYSPQGDYQLTVEIVDNDGNTLTLTPADLDALGVPHIVNQQAAGDVSAPMLNSLLVAPTSVDTSTSDQQVNLTVGGLDDLSGIDLIGVTLNGPGATQINGGTAGTPDSGSPTNGVWSVPITIPQGSPTGSYALSLELTDAVGHTTTLSSGALGSGGFPNSVANNDLTAPLVSIDGGPGGPNSDASPTFTFTAEAGASVQCSLDHGTASFAACSGPASHTPAAPLADGNWVFRVKATDAATNSATATRSFTVDTVAPETQIDSGPTGLLLNATADFAFASEPGASFECRLDDADFAACSSPESLADLADGDHLFEVRAVDAAGNADPSPASRGFSVDAAGPQVAITFGPGETTSDPTPTFGFDAESAARVECSFDQGTPSFGPCSTDSSATPDAPLPGGDWTFRVRATDDADRSATATREFTIDRGSDDTEAPETVIDGGPAAKTFQKKATFTFSADGAVRFECKFDKAGWTECTSPAKYKKLKRGKHTFRVRGIDAAGNVDPTPAKLKFKVVTL